MKRYLVLVALPKPDSPMEYPIFFTDNLEQAHYWASVYMILWDSDSEVTELTKYQNPFIAISKAKKILQERMFNKMVGSCI